MQEENGKIKLITVDMGEPILEPNKIPVKSNENPVKNLLLNAENREFKFTCVSMGNPHGITFIDEDVNSFDVCKFGKKLEVDSVFPQKANIEFVNIIDEKNIKMRVWERGAGETLACGTGACAVTVASVLNGYTKREVTVKLLGGDLKINWSKEDNHIYMTGPATTVFEGEIDI